MADKAHNVLRVIRSIWIIYNAAALVGFDLILVNDPFKSRAITQAVFKDLRRKRK